MRVLRRCLIILALLTTPIGMMPVTLAFESSSTSFEIHAGDAHSIAGQGSSTSFINRSAGGQVSSGFFSNVKRVYAGILYWLYSLFKPDYTQVHYRWRNDDGNETTATWAAAEDTTLTNLNTNVVKRLRFQVSNEGWTRGSGPTFQIEFARLSSGSDCINGPFATGYTAVPTGTSLHWKMATSANVNDADPTTNNAGITDANPTFVAGQIKSTGNTTSAITVTSENFTEIEYVMNATSNAISGATYCFRLTNVGSTTNFTYTNYARATLSVGLPPTGELTSVVFDTTGSASFLPTYNSFLWKGSVGTGKVRFQLATSNCSNGATNAPTCSTGTWTFIGGTLCTNADWYDGGSANTATEITCAPANHNNQRYFKYKIQLCSATDCTSSGATSPTVSDVVVNWSP